MSREERVVAALEPLLEEDGRLVAAHDLGRAHEPVQRLDRLDRVALDRRAERLLDDAVEVDEHVVAQEVVHLLLARAVLAHEAAQRRALVGGVVVDVRAGIAAPALDHPVDEALEDLALAVAVARPRGLVAHGAVLVAVAPAEQVLEPARRLVERMALEVEPDVAEVGLREQPEAAPLLAGRWSTRCSPVSR